MSKGLGAWMLWILASRIRVTDWVKVVPWRVKGKTKGWNSVRKLDPNLHDLVYFWILDQEFWYTHCDLYHHETVNLPPVHGGQLWAEWPSTLANFPIASFSSRPLDDLQLNRHLAFHLGMSYNEWIKTGL